MNRLGTWAAAIAAMGLAVGAFAATTVDFASKSPTAPPATTRPTASTGAATPSTKEVRSADDRKPVAPPPVAAKPAR